MQECLGQKYSITKEGRLSLNETIYLDFTITQVHYHFYTLVLSKGTLPLQDSCFLKKTYLPSLLNLNLTSLN